MIDPKFLLQTGPVLSTEKYACRSSNLPCVWCSYETIENLNIDEHRLHSIPVGSVEFVKKYCDHVGLKLPKESISYLPGTTDEFIKRAIRKGSFSDAKEDEFVKPVAIKSFTGDIKKNLSIDSLEPVWISEAVEFESEFRFYIQTSLDVKVVGWSRYDDLNVTNPDPDLDFVLSIAKNVHKDLGPNAFSVDIGWRSDLQSYDLVELNDAWALGLYNNNDPQSSPPSSEDYAHMLISRWWQLLFCNTIDDSEFQYDTSPWDEE